MKKQITASLLILVLGGGYCTWALSRPIPNIEPIPRQLPSQTVASKLVWPVEQAAVGVLGSDIVQTHGTQTPAPTASTAKVLTALVVLNAKPLSPGQQGPLLTLTDADVALYNNYTAQQGSVVPVTAGEQISEYQALQTLMLPSANNMADSLAIWAFGSLDAYKTAAAIYLSAHGLKDTRLGADASGLDPGTTSTAHDLVAIGTLAMADPVLETIVGQQTADNIPVAGTIRNVNFLLGSNNIVGVKTGNSDQAGGVYVSASTTVVNGKTQTLVTALVGAPDLYASLKDSLPLIQSSQTNFQTITLARAGAVVGSYHAAWGPTVNAIATQNLEANGFGGASFATQTKLKPITVHAESRIVGTIQNLANKDSVDVKLQSTVPKPSLLWKLTHPTR